MFKSAAGALVIVGAESAQRRVFWKGLEIPTRGLVMLDSKLFIKVPTDPTLATVYAEMEAAGIDLKVMK